MSDWDLLVNAAKVAPAFTAALAFGAAVIAIWSLYTQKRIARRRAAIDFFLRTEMDEHMIAAHRQYMESIEALKSEPDVAAFVSSAYYANMRRYLNIHELMAVGVKQKVFDDAACRAFWSGELETAYNDCNRVISHQDAWSELISLQLKWKRGKGS